MGDLLMVLLFERVLLGPPGGEDQLHGLDEEVAALDEPFVSLKAVVMSRLGCAWVRAPSRDSEC